MGRHESKQYFAAIPARAIGDTRLSALHYKALGAIALHDRMAAARKKGQGCWASRKTLAKEIGCNYSNLSTAMTQLATWGYIYSRPHPLSKKQTILHVVYDGRDAAFAGVKPGKDALPTGKQSDAEEAGDGLPTGEQLGQMVCPDSEEIEQNQSVAEDNIYSAKRVINSAEAENENSAETASSCDADLLGNEGSEHGRALTTGNRLGRIQTRVKSLEGERLTERQIDGLHEMQTFCEQVEDESEAHLGGIGCWAQRLGIDIEYLLDDLDDDAHNFEPFNPVPDLSVMAGLDLCPLLAGKPGRFTAVIGGRA